MLLELRYTNFFSIKESTTISFLAEALSEHKSSLLTYSKKITDKKVLPLKLFYGPHNSGKQKVLDGLRLIQRLLCEQIKINNVDTNKLAYTINKPTYLGLTVAINNNIYDYDVGFVNSKFIYERFQINNLCLFERNHNNVHICRTPKCLSYYEEKSNKNLSVNEKQFNSKYSNMNDKLFLTTVFSTFIASVQCKIFLSYMSENFLFFSNSRVDTMKIKNILIKYGFEIDNYLNSFEPFDYIDVIIKYCIKNGICLVIGENYSNFDPLKIIPLIERLHNKKSNRECQLLMATYQVLYMHKDIIRRDEVDFVYKLNDETVIVNLSELATREENYIKKFLSGDYIDFYNYKLKYLI